MLGSIISAGIGLLGSLFGGNDAGKATINAANENKDLLSDLRERGMRSIDDSVGEAEGYIRDGMSEFGTLDALGRKGSDAYENALGLNGAGGSAAARRMFQASPGYGFSMDQGLQALERRAGAQGRLQSGQTGIDTMRFATGLADQEWDDWLKRLQGERAINANGINTATQGRAGGFYDLGNLELGALDTRLGLDTGVLSGMMDANNMVAEGEEANYSEKENKKSNIFGSLGKLGGSIGNAVSSQVGGLNSFMGRL